MKNIKLWFVCLMAAMTMSFVACNDDDESSMKGDTPPAALIGTWNIGGGNSITFRDNGTGEMTLVDYEEEAELVAGFFTAAKGTITKAGSTSTFSFKWKYTDLSKQVTIALKEGEIVWTIISLSDDSLVIEDSEGDEISMQKESGNTDVPTTPDNYNQGPDNAATAYDWESVPYGLGEGASFLTWKEDFSPEGYGADIAIYFEFKGGHPVKFMGRMVWPTLSDALRAYREYLSEGEISTVHIALRGNHLYVVDESPVINSEYPDVDKSVYKAHFSVPGYSYFEDEWL